ncbi:MAG: glycerophosphodiester phosphodiesterase [Oscillospiraceae bacterium]|nr:glycerophosphodiester phosphodiesterase [Oscillospiraceae bacterium]
MLRKTFLFWPVVILVILYILANRCRTNHPGLEALQGWSYAHRGLHGDGRPENSMAAFRAALEGGYGIELDIHLLKDGNLAVMHDSLLARTTGREGRIEDLTTEDLKNYTLEGTSETIPTFQEVLDLYDGKAPLIVELKPVGGNHAALTEAACTMLESYSGVYCMESFDPRCIAWLKKNRPQIIRGQLSENFLKSDSKMPWLLRLALTHDLGNFLTVPDFVAYKFADRNNASIFVCRKFWKPQLVSWTLKTPEEYDIAVKEGWLPIFEGFRP